jgi:hypothetical protein
MIRGDENSDDSNDGDVGGMPGHEVRDQDARAPGEKRSQQAIRTPVDGEPDIEAENKARTILTEPMRVVWSA